MHSGPGCFPGTLLIATVAALTGCGGGNAGGDEAATAGAAGLAVCDLLTDAEVAEVLPGHDGGIVTADGGSLIEGVDTWQCSYTAQGEDATDFDLLTVTVNVATTPELFDEVRPTPAVKRETYDNFTEIQAGDGGFTYGEPDDMMIDVWQGTTLVSLELRSDEAGTNGEQLVSLASAALANAMR
jgi:hypothetical protein